jgi:hypothetical protein
MHTHKVHKQVNPRSGTNWEIFTDIRQQANANTQGAILRKKEPNEKDRHGVPLGIFIHCQLSILVANRGFLPWNTGVILKRRFAVYARSQAEGLQ